VDVCRVPNSSQRHQLRFKGVGDITGVRTIHVRPIRLMAVWNVEEYHSADRAATSCWFTEQQSSQTKRLSSGTPHCSSTAVSVSQIRPVHCKLSPNISLSAHSKVKPKAYGMGYENSRDIAHVSRPKMIEQCGFYSLLYHDPRTEFRSSYG
jgi:hypothetical protein